MEGERCRPGLDREEEDAGRVLHVPNLSPLSHPTFPGRLLVTGRLVDQEQGGVRGVRGGRARARGAGRRRVVRDEGARDADGGWGGAAGAAVTLAVT